MGYSNYQFLRYVHKYFAQCCHFTLENLAKTFIIIFLIYMYQDRLKAIVPDALQSLYNGLVDPELILPQELLMKFKGSLR